MLLQVPLVLAALMLVTPFNTACVSTTTIQLFFNVHLLRVTRENGLGLHGLKGTEVLALDKSCLVTARLATKKTILDLIPIMNLGIRIGIMVVMQT